MVQASSMETFEAAQDQARVIMRNRRHLGFGKPDDFSVETGESVLELWQSATRGIYVVTVVVTAISLIVGGIVVMNIMLVSVTERTFEVGLRKAVGATRKQILRQTRSFCYVDDLVRGIIGLLLAWGLTTLITALASITMTITLGYILLALIVSTAIGMVAGIYPAFKAARLDPILALTHAT